MGISACSGANVALNLKNAEDTELVVSKKVGKAFTCCPNASFNMNNFHAKAQYGIKSSATWDCRTNDFKCSDHMKINDNLTGIFSVKTNFNDGFFKKCSVGMAFNFNA